MADPSNEVCPNFALDFYRPMRDALLVNADNEEQILDNLVQMWTAEHNQRVELWNERQRVEALLAEEAEGVRRTQEREAQCLVDDEAERERTDLEKKKPKMNDFDDEVEVGNVIIPRPSQYALLKLKNFEFVELWYFSPEGCRDAAKSSSSIMEDTFGISKVDDILTMRPVAALKQSRNVVNDYDLPISDFFRAKNSFLVHIEHVSWPKKHINALAEFFWHLENHPICNRRHGNTVMLLYAHRVCRLWHDDLKRGSAFNILKLNDSLMNAFNEEVVDQRLDDVLHKASFPFSLKGAEPQLTSFHHS
ncbi:hypothetical protein PAXINDRAFT_19805 [Paxillus involutus ATCC 200175]|uniref:Uncharacterized protein n=1 Tax=Paxillus involutus ATCC 200175 TaxID=664439 RepID=A0A0C9TFY5_PAXIN|nr:hypothetical protein PAXINDRAFT_19805 [Paxillus involutus ATCC 200175]